MIFEEFVAYVKAHILEDWLKDASVEVEDVLKNNGISYHALYIRQGEERSIPALYLEEYYAMYERGISLDELISQIRADYEIHKRNSPDMECFDDSYINMKDKIFFRLVNYSRNESLLKTCPHIRVGDLAVTFRWMAYMNDSGIASCLIDDDLLKIWAVDMYEILNLARVNTPRLFPPHISNIVDLLSECDAFPKLTNVPCPMYVLTNESKMNGASVILYEGLLQNICDTLEDDIYILPSSIHEVILVPLSYVDDLDNLKLTVPDVNSSAVAPGEILSDSVYYYNRQKEKLQMV